MDTLPVQFLLFLETIIFLSVVFLHLMRKSSTAISLYIVQSSVVTVLLLLSLIENQSPLLYAAIIATVAVKLVVAPYFFFNLIKKHQLKFLGGSYFNMPMTLFIITLLTALTRASIFKQIASLSQLGQDALLLAFGTILISVFLIINRKGALSQMLGILSLENGIVSFALFSGLEQNPGLQLGITINIFVWVFMATLLASMIFRHYGSLDVTAMKRLTD